MGGPYDIHVWYMFLRVRSCRCEDGLSLICLLAIEPVSQDSWTWHFDCLDSFTALQRLGNTYPAILWSSISKFGLGFTTIFMDWVPICIYIYNHIYIHYMWLYVHIYIYIYTWLYNSKICIIHCFQFWDWWTAGRLHPTLPRSWLKSSSPGMEKSTKRSLELKWRSFWSCRQWPFKYHKFVEKKQTFMIIYGMYQPIYNHLYINAIYIYNLTMYYHHL